MKHSILIVDDDEQIRSQLKWALAEDFDVHTAADRPEALAIFRNVSPRLVVLDLGLPPHPHEPVEGFAVLEELLRFNRSVKVVVVSGNAEHANALKAVEFGAFDFFSKPPDIEVLRVILNRALHVASLEDENRRLLANARNGEEPELLGTCPQMEKVFKLIKKVAAADIPVLITGESGTGKDLVARAIHRRSSFSDGPFRVINCGSIPENLLESELFGYEKGAFTGATNQRIGKLELAEGGTVFLDEIGELPLGLQAKLLRFLQERTIERVGGRQSITVNARVVAATTKNLCDTVAAGTFREDLYFRLAVIQIPLPALRERGDDVIMIAREFVQRYARDVGKGIRGLSRTAEKAIRQNAWPGNVRELENTIRRAVVLAESNVIVPEDLGLGETYPLAKGATLREARDALERELVENALARMAGNISQAAKMLGVSRPTMYDLIDRHGLHREATAKVEGKN